MKRISLLFLVLILSACSYFVSIDELSRNIQAQMQREFDSSLDYRHYRLKVMDVKIVERSHNSFQAISQVQYQGESFPIKVLIQKVEQGYSWQLEEDAFAFIDEVEIQRYEQQLQQELAMISAEFEHDDGFDDYQVNKTTTAVEQEPSMASQRVEEPIPVGNITAYSQ
ncbi:hypothetical protein BS636_02690 [Acinetobacter sp. LoGeW2-3]|uniref:hypothetical protein n=1 Tax=Acinetobacter sp. LoGeW2-3 TaxID=1808001 RepID=UPI000C058665|nr:hypothetical protein [Acinetobacter sp. LoGeW2-3]ATO18645.1 hypothetical protein BS636_02690 [Acinetobacter sp. LoGeW2-3]